MEGKQLWYHHPVNVAYSVVTPEMVLTASLRAFFGPIWLPCTGEFSIILKSSQSKLADQL